MPDFLNPPYFGTPEADGGGSGGTVTTIPDGSTNGVTWTVATRTTTPTFTFSVAGLVDSNATLTGNRTWALNAHTLLIGSTLFKADGSVNLGDGSTAEFFTVNQDLTVDGGLILAGTLAMGLNAGITFSGTGAASTRTNLGVAIGTNVQAYDAALDALSGGSDFVRFAGPASSTKIFTLPNAAAAVLTDNAAVTGAQGGTGVANTGKTITLGANLVTTGTDIPTFAFPSSATGRAYTYPTTTATLARTDAAQTFTGNQSISAGVIAQTISLAGSAVGCSITNTSAGTGTTLVYRATNDASKVCEFGIAASNHSSLANTGYFYTSQTNLDFYTNGAFIMRLGGGTLALTGAQTISSTLAVTGASTLTGLVSVGVPAGHVGGTIFTDFTSTSTTHTDGTEDDLFTHTTVANTFGANGDSVEQVEHVSFVSSATAARRLKKYFGGTLIFDSGSVTLSLGGEFSIYTVVIRESATVVRCDVSVTSTSASTVPYSTYTRITGLTLSSTNVLKTTGIASGTGAASADIANILSRISWNPA